MKLLRIVFFPLAIIFISITATPFYFFNGMFEIKAESQNDKNSSVNEPLTVSSKENSHVQSLMPYDSIMVIHFHPTAQCSCCINVGNFSRKGLEKFYSKAYKERHIVFKECNIDEDSLTARRYKIFGSALGFKKFLKAKEDFKEIESVWEFCEDEGKFLTDFQKELQSFIAGKKEDVKETTK